MFDSLAGTVISGYVIKTERDAMVYHLIGQKSPQAPQVHYVGQGASLFGYSMFFSPQAFYPVEEEGLSVVKGDWLVRQWIGCFVWVLLIISFALLSLKAAACYYNTTNEPGTTWFG